MYCRAKWSPSFSFSNQLREVRASFTQYAILLESWASSSAKRVYSGKAGGAHQHVEEVWDFARGHVVTGDMLQKLVDPARMDHHGDIAAVPKASSFTAGLSLVRTNEGEYD